ncbi:unnamed protein product [Mytilus edulis]|uniref:Uncharacterized protein n=1 Tax=Mytilus edulis TaxID=6550 RepID=A0A8S3QFD5_MYTED|nr:unnamed protein product [Mytilus edulis]
MNYFYLLTLALFLECVGCALDHENKRLLLNDPDAIARLANLEQQNQLLTQKVLDLESKMATMQSEYEVNGFAHDSAYNDVPCAVCRNMRVSSSIMIPGRHSCYSGWTEEYNGILASGHEGETASSYICIDKNPEYVSSGEKREGGLMLYVVGLKCGPLPCPPYHNNHQVNCVVCSK